MEISEASFQLPITIREVVNKVHKKQYLLPAIQREFVWEPKQITELFDSLMRGYPIGSFLFWQVSKDKVNDFQFYEFIRDYHERDNTHNPKANITGEEGIVSILDGQQRLTAIYIALKGTYSFKLYRKRTKTDKAFPKKKLYLNLLSESDVFAMKYDFRFLTEEEATNSNDTIHWFEVGKIVEFNGFLEINAYLRKNDLFKTKFPEDCLFNLFEVITQKKIINYYLETSQELDKVLNIFIRVNSGGTILSYSDLLLSIATAQWKTRDAREEINSFVDEINQTGNGFTFDKDFVLKSCLILSDIKDITFKVDNFNSENMGIIEAKWGEMMQALRIAVELIASFGYNFQTLVSNATVIPIAYYILKNGNPDNFVLSGNYQDDRTKIKKWLILSLLKRVFSGQPDNVFRPLRKILQDSSKGFPLEEIVAKFKGTTKSIIFNEDDIEFLLNSKYGQSHTFSVLSVLYPTLDFRNRFHQDHIYPRSLFNPKFLRKKGISETDIDFYLDNVNNIGNIQLLEGLPNEEKSNQEFEEWILKYFKGNEQEQKEYMQKNYIPEGLSIGFDNFKEFFKKRTDILRGQLKRKLI
ncbi:MAG: DUF262 domain-containing protein [Candidatus Gracilibacteria bacterium]|jgi:uncharacterized protein with ParB-like and HNH nuclease domain